MKLCFATNNAHKLDEIKAILGKKFEIISLKDIGCSEELPEERNTIEGNSLQKADYVFYHFDIDCFADDTGLEVEALNGAPGVYSARYAGEQRNSEDNIDLLLKNLHGVENPKARFRTVITFIRPQEIHQFEGVVEGIILKERRGKGGFGYDSVFLPNGFEKTLAEMSMDEKNQISHRGRAMENFVQFLTSSKF
ncbi:MAG TPA: non-canonical purine NTP diphosphatase [Cyclobacteriaceae bacterium]|nr:non-canonical purine NTP diphosphatase [Cyclobacteriaceae bacterium]